MSLQRLVLTFRSDGLEARVLYRTQASSGPSTKARQRAVTALVRTGLEQALETLEGSDIEDLGTSGYEVREDVIGLSATSADALKRVKGATT